jgi:hypothetical protein
MNTREENRVVTAPEVRGRTKIVLVITGVSE